MHRDADEPMPEEEGRIDPGTGLPVDPGFRGGLDDPVDEDRPVAPEDPLAPEEDEPPRLLDPEEV